MTELLLCTGSAAAVRIGDALRPITQRPLRTSDIASIVAGTPIETAIRDLPGDIDQQAVLGARRLNFRVSRSPGNIQISIRLLAPAESREAAPALGFERNDLSSAELQPAIERTPTAIATPQAGAVRQPLAAAAHRDTPPRWDAALTEVLAEARRAGASDVHFVSDQPVRWRLVGKLTARGERIAHDQLAAALELLLNESQKAALAERGYADFSVDQPSTGRLRVNVCRQRTGLKACMRLVPDSPPTLSELGLPAELGKVQNYHQGLIVISGPNGHGKTTTLAALVDLLNQTRPAHIITVEDPVEFLHAPKRSVVSQREVGVHTKSFQTALKGALREDPDVIAIGELRDRETVEMALTASETGHVVLATMSTPNGASTIERLIDMFAPEDQSQVRATLAGALKLVISQRLVPVSDGSRLVAAAELITGNVPLWTLIRDNKLYQLPSLLQRGRAYGMIRVEDSLNDLLQNGVIDELTARANADEPKNIGSPLKQGVPVPAQNPATAPGVMGIFRKKN